MPIAIPIASVRTCLTKQCCVPRFKQPIGELIMVTFMAIIYLGTVVGVILPRIDKMLQLEEVRSRLTPLMQKQ